MKLAYFFFTSLFLLANSSFSQLTVNIGMTPLQYVQGLVGPGITVSNVTYTGNADQIGTFDGSTSNIGFNSGLRYDYKKLNSSDISLNKDYEKVFSATSFSAGLYYKISDHSSVSILDYYLSLCLFSLSLSMYGVCFTQIIANLMFHGF